MTEKVTSTRFQGKMGTLVVMSIFYMNFEKQAGCRLV